SSYHSPTRGYVTSTYDAGEIDAVAVYCGPLRRSFLLPMELVAGKGLLSLRVMAAANNQRAALNFAADYEFPGAVAQLEERVACSEEVRGSSPLSSTVREAAPATEHVGAHEFRNHFGLYLERASRGTEVLISRRGRPYARLVPPGLDLNTAPVAA